MIVSTTNPRVKYIRSLLAHRRVRTSERVFVVEGIRLVQEAMNAGLSIRLALYDAQNLQESSNGTELLAVITDQEHCHAAAPQAIAATTDTVTPQGVVAVVERPMLAPRPGLRVILDNIQDPGNVGTLLRSAEAVGAGVLLCSRGTADVFSPKVVRAAMGAHFSLPIRSDLQWEELADMLQNIPRIYATSADATTPYYDADWRQSAALIIGNEAQGISPAGLALATKTLTIPMRGHAESLNAAVAGSVIMFDMLRQTSG